MVRNAENIIDLTTASVSFIPSLKCNNKCTFCMYQAGPDVDVQLNLDDAARFVETVDWNKICGWGFYGGEPSINMELYQQFIDLIPKDVLKFIITNGSWSMDIDKLHTFLKWCSGQFKIYISRTKEHQKCQCPPVIDKLSPLRGIVVKEEDEEMHPMGRNFKGGVNCTEKCMKHEQPVRLGLFPTGDVLLQNCDGAYPVVSHISEGFTVAFDNAVRVRKSGLCECKQLSNINDILERKVDAYSKN